MLFSDKAKGFTGAILSGIAYGLNPLFALPLYERGFTTSSILFYRFFHAALFLAVMLLLQKKTFRLPRQMIPQMILMGMFCSLSAFTLFLSFQYAAVRDCCYTGIHLPGLGCPDPYIGVQGKACNGGLGGIVSCLCRGSFAFRL